MSPHIKFIALGCLMTLVIGCTGTKQATYPTPDAAVVSLVDALRSQDKTQLRSVLGPDCEEVINSGDEVADKAGMERVVAAYTKKHSLQPDGADSMTLLLGEKDWPLPIPIVKDKAGTWRFDTAAGEEEILNRRIGRNELDTVQVCLAIVDAQREYVQRDPDNDALPEYATKFISAPGAKDGLYWPTSEGEAPSPLGPLIADASAQGYQHKSGESRPYHGYYYKMLMGQGPDAPGGARDYLIEGNMIAGFAAIAFPADYGNSGIMTFIVNQDGVVYQCDLGEDTAKVGSAIKTFNPDAKWSKAETPEKAAAALAR